MQSQNYATHRQWVPGFHYVLGPVLFLTLIGACVNLYESWGDHQRIYSASLLVVLTAAMLMTAIYGRLFALKAQDRAIRAEENLRHFVLTGKLLDPRLQTLQVVALRFASDAELPLLATRAAEEKMPPDAIKRAIKNWKGDFYRV
jgi:hypothetical protein